MGLSAPDSPSSITTETHLENNDVLNIFFSCCCHPYSPKGAVWENNKS